MKDLLQQNTSAFDPTKTAFVKEIAVLFGQVGGDDDDDVVVREVESDDTYRCPITTQKIVNPVTNGVCKHVASKDAVMQMLRNAKNKAECKCFMTGCNAMWKADTVREDSVFQDKMDAWFRRQSQVRV
jgi:SUMO ligase MMS21 Smc5/6 complex component